MTRNALILMPAKVLEGVLLLATASIYSRVFPPVINGQYQLVNSTVLALFLVTAAWLYNATARFISEYRSPEGEKTFYSTFLLSFGVITLAVLAVGAGAWLISGSFLCLAASVMLTTYSLFTMMNGLLIQTDRLMVRIAASLLDVGGKLAFSCLLAALFTAETPYPAVFGAVLGDLAASLVAMAALAARRREGQRESGDTGTWFKRPDGSLFVLLCDGMGSGQAAHRESGLAVRLLEEFLRSGMDSAAALRTVNSALALKNEESGAFTTVDLLRLDLYTGSGEICKLGAAPTYIRKGTAVSRLSGAALPAGLADGDGVGPDVTALTLEPGDWVLLVSDGVADGEDDGWVRERLEKFDGHSPKELARQVMEESEKRVGSADDRTVVVIGVRSRTEAREKGAD